MLTIDFEQFCRDPKILVDEMRKTGEPGLVRCNGFEDIQLKILTLEAANDKYMREKEFIDESIER